MMTKKSLKTFTNVLLVSVMALGATGCTRDISSGTYAGSHVGEAVSTYEGTIIGKRVVMVKEGEKLTDNTAGMVTGAIAGGVLGSMFGGGRGQLATTAGGALLGAGAGALAQDKLSEQQAFEYTVKLKDGSMKTIVQGKDMELSVGQKVMVHISSGGRSRITAM